MIAREISEKILELAGKFPVISLTGPRQSGKTTLIKSLCPNKDYISLEDLDILSFANEDPRRFLATYPNGAVLDEVQRVPALFSYLQGIVDNHGIVGEFILSGSQNFLLMERISQTLAGRVAILKLMPFSNREIASADFSSQSLEQRIFTGGYPRIYDKNIAPSDFFSSYIQTYVERDIRQLKSIHDLSLFSRFLKLCAARIGQLLNIASLASDCGISHFTAQSWLSLLQTSYIVYLLEPHHVNLSKRLTKMPKLYFYDTGLACHLLNIREENQLQSHFMRGSLFENMMIIELVKLFANEGREAPIYFWRDKTGHEIDCLIEMQDSFFLIEIKSSETFNLDFLKNIRYYEKLVLGKYKTKSFIIYAGDAPQIRDSFSLLSWKQDLGSGNMFQ